MASHFDFENEIKRVTLIDKPILNVPAARWQRKSANDYGLQNASLNISQHNSSSLSPLLNRSSKTPLSSRTPKHGSVDKTPGKPKSKSRNSSLVKTPNRACRFIANRQATNFEIGHYKLVSENAVNNENADREEITLAQGDYKKKMKKNLQQASGTSCNENILSFEDRPTGREGYHNNSKVLYSSAKKSDLNHRKTRHIPTTAFRVLDAPDLEDDYYLNLVDWSSINNVAVALGKSLYFWDASSGEINMIKTTEGEGEMISSVKWIPNGQHIAVGNNNAEVQLWDINTSTRLRNMTSHGGQVGCLSWNDHILSSGSVDGFIHHHDVRISEHHVATLSGHTEKICGLEWSSDGKYLASGGNDNLVNVYTDKDNKPLHTFSDHQGAVKAIAWCPWQTNLLATGGGTTDRHIRFWNTCTGVGIKAVDTKSQVCAIKWSTHYKELVSSHGYVHNQLTVWSYPSMQWMQDLTGHTARVMHLALSPDGQTVLSGAGDETLRLWECFAVDPSSKKSSKKSSTSLLGDSRLHFSIR